MKKRIILFLAIVVLPFLSMAQWRSKVDMAYLDSVASRGEEGWLMNRWGWWKFPPELTKQGGAAIKLQTKCWRCVAKIVGLAMFLFILFQMVGYQYEALRMDASLFVAGMIGNVVLMLGFVIYYSVRISRVK